MLRMKLDGWRRVGLGKMDLLGTTVLLLTVRLILLLVAYIMKFYTSREIHIKVGDTVTLPCPTSSSPFVVHKINWQFRKTECDPPTSFADKIRSGKITVDPNHPQDRYNITLQHATLDDAGLYECVESVENGGRGPKHTVVVKVSGY